MLYEDLLTLKGGPRRCKENSKGCLRLTGNTQRRTDLEETPLRGWGSDFIREVVVIAPCMAEKFPGFPGPGLVHSSWAADSSPLGTGEMRLVGRCVGSGHHCPRRACSTGCLQQEGPGEGQGCRVTKPLCPLSMQLPQSNTQRPH